MSLSYIRQRDARLAVHHGVCRQPLRTTPPEAVSQWEAMRCVCVDRTDPVGARAHAAHEHALLHRPWGLARVPKVDVCRRRGARCRWRAVPQWLWSTTTTMTPIGAIPKFFFLHRNRMRESNSSNVSLYFIFFSGKLDLNLCSMMTMMMKILVPGINVINREEKFRIFWNRIILNRSFF